MTLSDQVAALERELSALREQKDGAYNERDRCVALIARMAVALGFCAGLGQHDPADTSWDAGWRTIVFIDLPAGQVSWHIADHERPLFDFLPAYPGAWDGHSTEEKYRRVGAALRASPSPSAGAVPEVRLAPPDEDDEEWNVWLGTETIVAWSSCESQATLMADNLKSALRDLWPQVPAAGEVERLRERLASCEEEREALQRLVAERVHTKDAEAAVEAARRAAFAEAAGAAYSAARAAEERGCRSSWVKTLDDLGDGLRARGASGGKTSETQEAPVVASAERGASSRPAEAPQEPGTTPAACPSVLAGLQHDIKCELPAGHGGDHRNSRVGSSGTTWYAPAAAPEAEGDGVDQRVEAFIRTYSPTLQLGDPTSALRSLVRAERERARAEALEAAEEQCLGEAAACDRHYQSLRLTEKERDIRHHRVGHDIARTCARRIRALGGKAKETT